MAWAATVEAGTVPIQSELSRKNGRSPGTMRSKPQTPRAGCLGIWRTCGLPAIAREASGGGNRTSISLDVARRRGPWVLREPWRPARPWFLQGGWIEWNCGLLRADQRTGTMMLALFTLRGRVKRSAAEWPLVAPPVAGRLIGNAGVVGAIGQVARRLAAAEVELAAAGVADRPFAGFLG